MKKYARGSNKMVMFALLAVLLISLGYLSMQGKEGMAGGVAPRPKPATKPIRETPPTLPMPPMPPIS
jgi:hypothetical protein